MSSRHLKRIFRAGLALGMFLGVLVLGITLVHAQPDVGGLAEVGTSAGLPTQSLGVTIGKIVRTILSFLGIIAFGIVFYAGFLWMTARGNEDQVVRAKAIMRNGLIGLVIILVSYSLTQFILSRLLSATSNAPAHCFNNVKDEDETGTDCGGSCGVCGGGSGSGDLPGGTFLYISSLPASGEACVRNVHPTIIFNRDVDIATVNSNISIQKKTGSVTASGTWKYGSQKNVVVFDAEGSCGAGESDCLEASTDYVLSIKIPEAIKSLVGNLPLNCALQAGCGPVEFKTGASIDRLPPTISIISPANNSSVPAGGAPVPVKIQFSDDNGVQSLALYQNANLVTSQSLSGCRKAGTIDVNWSTAILAPGTYTLQANALDWAAHSAATTTRVRVTPFHCFNDILEPDLGEVEKGPPACGGECGSCGGDVCRDNSECSSGYCEMTGTSGKCVDKMRIESVSPGSGAPGTFVTLSGYYFGDAVGEVYFTQGPNPNITSKTNVIKANLAGCGPSARAWTNNQIIVEVPVGAQTGPVFVLTNSILGRDGVSRKFTDASNDSWGPKLPDFQVTAQVRPGLCSVIPGTGVGGDSVQMIGKNFGLFDSANDQILFGGLKAGVAAPDWTNESVKTSVPLLIDQGAVGVKVVNNGIESNGVRFMVNPGTSVDSPLISTITPGSGARGEYITITGKNFGNTLGSVWLKATPESEAIVADTNFPAGCASAVWRDDQIVIKFPKDKGDIGSSYFIQVKTSDNKITRLDPNFKFNLQAGDPAPGICSLSPVSGPIPFPIGQSITIRGEYFGTNPSIYFWKTGASATAVDGRVVVEAANILSINDTTITLRPPATINTGPVVVYRAVDKKVSNPASFTILDCVKNGNKCTAANTTCCATGGDAGLCKPANELCSGTSGSSGYVWRFSTAQIPLVPKVVERCTADTGLGKNIPSPAPSIQWDTLASGDHHNVCRTALVTTEFSDSLDQITVNAGSVLVNKCSDVKDANNCVNPTPVKLAPGSFSLKAAAGGVGGNLRQYVALSPDTGKWDDNSWYQVVLKKGIKSDNKQLNLALSSDRPCEVTDSAYCFVFKTDSRDCRMKTVVITPYSYWTSVLESPMKYRTYTGGEGELRYYGAGLSDQRCIMMDTSGFDWQWSSGNVTYADIFGERAAQSVQASALGNTVGIGLSNPDNAVNISATARRGLATYTGSSPLTIDLNNPEVVNFWPQCQEACTNAEVAVQFNTTMSNRNLPGSAVGGTVQLLKCTDENCIGTVPMLNTTDVYLDPTSKFSLLKIANSQITSVPLEPNTLYQVILSASSTSSTAASNVLWSSARLNNPNSISKPYNKVFTWRFKTKNQACTVDRVQLTPQEYFASSINDRTTFAALAYSSPDTCSKEGQKLDPWSISWQWKSSDTKVGVVDTFTTKGTNRYCTNTCVRKGSDIPAGSETAPVCGNGVVEAGEDCDSPDKTKGCSLDCRFMGSTGANCGNGTVETGLGEACDPKDPASAQGCTNDCRHNGSESVADPKDVRASICGNGMIGMGEDCDQGIAAATGNKLSKLNCSSRCLHTGTKISAKWCFDNRLTQGGFGAAEYNRFCNTAVSQCGNKIQEPDEDSGCDDVVNGWNQLECNQFCLKKSPRHCNPNTEGCDDAGRYKGSSLLYSQPSVCGDGFKGIGEEGFCEQNFTSVRTTPLINPWGLVRGVGLGNPVGEPPTQRTTITAGTVEQTKGGLVSGAGTFNIKCGYKTDRDCELVYGKGYGVASNSCCYARPKLISTYPVNNSVNTCSNTYLEAVFNTQIDSRTLPGNVLIARGAASCAPGQEDVTGLVAFENSIERETQIAWYERVFRWVKNLVGSPVEAAPTRWCAGSDLGSAQVIPSDISTSTSRIQVKLDSPLANSLDYAIILKDGVKTIQGVSVGQVNGKPISWRFITGPQICQLDSLSINPSQWLFSRAGATTTLQAQGSTGGGALIQGIPGTYDWEYIWGPETNPFVTLSQSTSSINIITAQNRNGEQDIRAAARLTANKITSATGTVATGRSHVVVLLCENPWPPKDLYIQDKGPFTIFPFEDKLGNNDGFDIASNTFNNTSIPASTAVADGYFNFSSYYCADKGSPGTLDDLPYLRGTVQVGRDIVSASSSLKRFIFTNTQNSDAIGVQIFPNPRHLTAEEWYSAAKTSGGQGFAGSVQRVAIDGYDAVTDGNNIYIDALNYSSVTGNIYSNIYLFSINENASADTKTVFQQFVQNLRFNSNMTNYGYCGASATNPDFATACRSDLDCRGGQVCSASIDKLKRNYLRLRGLKTFESLLVNYFTVHNKYPDLPEGTLLKGQNLSVWPSWATFGTILGTGLPSDPVNKLGSAGTCGVDEPFNRFCTDDNMCPAGKKCVFHDAQTGWSTENRRFSFACATSSYAYRYISVSSSSFMVKSNFENPAVNINNFDAFAREFINTSRFIINDKNGICNQDQEISTINQGRCGDGSVNAALGEECDPPGYVRYGACQAAPPFGASAIKVDVCSPACKWTPSSTPYIDCSALSKCGNGKLESGEQCDEGILNGRYNHCTKTCALPPAEFCGDGTVQKAYEVCDIKDKLTGKDGVCISGIMMDSPCDVDDDCKDTGGIGGGSSFDGVCRLISDTKVRYARTQKDSCNFDCQSSGPYCGDGVVEAQFGEECDGNQTCSIAGAPGSKLCSSVCRWADGTASAWWQLNDAFEDRTTRDTKFFDSVSSSTLSCKDADCPEFTRKVRGDRNAFKFNGTNFIASPANALLSPTTGLTVEAWVNPAVYHDWVRILEKGGYLRNGGYTFQFNGGASGNRSVGLTVWSGGSKTATGIATIQEIPLNQWSQITATYQRQGNVHTFKIYVNGKLDNSYATTTPDQLLATTNDQLMLGRAVSGSSGFEGLLSDVKVYSRALSEAEIANRHTDSWVCSLANSSVTTLPTGSAVCGDGKIDEGEACDRGSQNGIPCSPAYGKSCSFCSDSCRNVVDVTSKEFCGNGVVEGPENCDTDPKTGIAYSSFMSTSTKPTRVEEHKGYEVLKCEAEPQGMYSYKKGDKKCVNTCTSIFANCVICGVDEVKGTAIKGVVFSALDPDPPFFFGFPPTGYVSVYDHPLMELRMGDKTVGHVKYFGEATYEYSLLAPDEDAEARLDTGPRLAKISTDPQCSFGDQRYKMRFAGDDGKVIDFPIAASPKTGQYSIIASPVIQRSVRPQDMRVVVSSVGNDADFLAGWLVPSLSPSSSVVEGSSFVSNPGTTRAFLYKSVTLDYYEDNNGFPGIWYHGKGSRLATNVESFTIDTSKMTDLQRAFYVRIPQTKTTDPGIWSYRDSARLRVDIYLPEDITDRLANSYRPAQTFYLNAGTSSDNPGAAYWHVFNLRKPLRGGGTREDGQFTAQIIPVNRTVTDLKNF